ncbi:MAG: pyruvate kinase [Gallionella sp.]|jgi:pyruvate kinase|nr:pyruvate kinase [Gallionella sp.]MCK9352905.1 pyruvate kinase [Gallionella sp.]
MEQKVPKIMRLPKRHITENLIPELEKLRDAAVAMEHDYRAKVTCIAPLYQASANNLMHYLALRQSDIRELQQDLALLGLSRLGRAEAHALSSIDAVRDALRALAGLPRSNHGSAPAIDIRSGEVCLNEHAVALLGMPSDKHATRIMVTMPSEAAVDAKLVHDLLAAGMDIMRINCAHDGPDAWLAMIRHLRDAERELGRTCKVYADLAGPKLRTGAISAAGRLAEFKVKRDVRGCVTAPSRIWLTPARHQEEPAFPVDGALPMDEVLLRAVRSGDIIEVDDTRGSKRSLLAMEKSGSSWLAHCQQHAFIAEGAGCKLYRKNNLLVQGKVAKLPEVFQPIVLKVGDELMLTRDQAAGCQAHYDDHGKLLRAAHIPCTLDAVFDAARPDQPVWLDDGKIGGKVLANDGKTIAVQITHAALQGSKLRAEKGINLPETDLNTPALTEADAENLRVLASHIDVIGLSFVRTSEDVLALHRQLQEVGAGHLGTVLKIETRQAFENLPMILLTSLCRPPVGIMVARGDLAVEIGFERLAEVQEEILWLCEAAHIPVIWATQVLESMAKNGIPTRAEVSDAALAIRAECVMLNKGPHIVETLRFLSGVLERMSGHQVKRRPTMRRLSVSHIPEHEQ